ncbi:MAG TPA: HEAT repeat domain-containing protein, partial [Anaerolineae bacterium]
MNESSGLPTSNHPQNATHGDVGGVEALMAALGSDDGLTRQDARLALVGAGFRSTPALLAALDAPNADLRWEAAKALCEIRDPRAAPALAQALEDDNPGVRWIAAEGLAALGPGALTALLEALVQRPPDVLLLEGAHRVLHALDRRHRLPAAAEPVLAALEGPAPDLTAPPAAQTALWSLAGQEGLDSSRELAVDVEKSDSNQEMKGASEMLIAMHAEVNCTDGEAGHCSHVIVDPNELKVTHLVIGKNERSPRPQRPPRPVVEESELPVVLKRPRLVVEQNQEAARPRPPHLRVEKEEHRATIPGPHVAVEEDESWDTQRLVPWEEVVKPTLDGIRLDCTQHE